MNIIRDRESGRSRGFGFVTLKSAVDVDQAIEYNGDLVISCFIWPLCSIKKSFKENCLMKCSFEQTLKYILKAVHFSNTG